MPETAFADLAERLTRALLTGDFALYRSVMAMPLRVVPRGGQPYVLETEAALQHDFDLYATAVRTAGVTDIWREVVRVTPDAAGTWRVAFRIHIMARAHRVAEPFGSEMLLVPGISGLRIAEIVSTAEHIDWTLGRGAIGPGSGLI